MNLDAILNSERLKNTIPYESEKTADVTGEGASEALVYLGTGGASTDELTVMRVEHDTPVLALFRDRDGKVSPIVFAEGASVMHTDGVELLPREHSIFSIHYEYNGNVHLEPARQDVRLPPQTD